MDEVKYKKGDIVLFRYGQKIKNGTIVIVDAQGTFFQQEEPSYDIEVEYSCAATPQIRQTGNRLSGLAETAYASLLAQCFV